MIGFLEKLRMKVKLAESQINEQLSDLLPILDAEYIQLIYNGFNEGKFVESSQVWRSPSAENTLSESVMAFVTQLKNAHIHHFFKAGEEELQQLEIIGFNYTYWLYVPIYTDAQHTASIVLAFNNSYPNDIEAADELINRVRDRIISSTIIQKDSSIVKDRDPFIEFGYELTCVIGRRELQQLIHTKLSILIPFSSCTFFLLDVENVQMENFLFESRGSSSAYPFNESVPILKLPVDDGLNISPYLNPEGEHSAESGMLFGLYSGIELIGYCIMLFPLTVAKGSYRKDIKMLVPQLSATILKIKMIEEVERVKRDLKTLEAINLELSVNKDKNDLLRSLYPLLSRIFNFSHHFVGIVNQDKLTISLLLQDEESLAKLHPKYKDTTKMSFSVNNQIVNKVLLSDEPLVFDLDVLASRNALPEFMVVNYESGIKKMAMVGLQMAGERIGIWTICLIENQLLSHQDLAVIKVISHQISIAAKGFQTSEIFREKKLEREFLGKISTQIAMISRREDLHRLFNRTLRSRFLFEGVSIINIVTHNFYESLLYVSDKPALMDGFYHARPPVRYQTDDVIMSKLLTAPDLVIYDLQNLIDIPGVPGYIRQEYESGIRIKVGFKLLKGGKVSGAIFYNLNGNNFCEQELELLSNISLQVSTAVSNVLANEEISERQLERELLFSLSTQIASIRNHVQLAEVITSKLKPYLGFSHVTILELNPDKDAFRVFLVDPDSSDPSHPKYQYLKEYSFPVNDGFSDQILMSVDPIIFSINEMIKTDAIPSYIHIGQELGSKQVIGIKFSKDSADFGFLLMFFKDENPELRLKSGLIKAISHQISTAVYNIIANHEVRELLDIRSRLLQFGIELRMVRDEQVLSNLLSIQLSTLFQAENFLVTALSENKKSHRAIFFNAESELAVYPQIQSLNTQCEEVKGDFFDEILKNDHAVVFDPMKIKGMKNVPQFIKSMIDPEKGVLASVMKLGEEPVGFIFFKHTNPSRIIGQPELFTSIISQIAIVIVNLLSHQIVQQQLKEIERYKVQLEEEKIYLATELDTINNYTEIIGQSPALQDSFHLVSQVSASDSTVLILGETGTGKELIARAIHNNSPRKNKLMVKVNCAALPANLIESELFGHERGSFTGATDRRIGKFELANGSTLFLDEVGEMPLDLQVKLLRVLQEKEVERVGGRGTIKVDVRIIAATNRDLEKEMKEGRFRSDLFYRLNIFPISLPPLRERKEDIELLVSHFIKHFSKKCGKSIDSISARALQDLQRYNWPGNVRELEHLIERSVLLANGNIIKQVLLPSPKDQQGSLPEEERDELKTINQNEKEHIYRVLQYCQGRIAGKGGAAEILGVPPTTLNSKIKRLGIKRSHMM